MYIFVEVTGQESHYPPANHHAIHLEKCPVPGHNHLLTTGADDMTLALSPEHQQGRYM